MQYATLAIAFLSTSVLAMQCVHATAQDRGDAIPYACSLQVEEVLSAADRERLGVEQLNKWIDGLRLCSSVTPKDIAELHRRLEEGETVSWKLRDLTARVRDGGRAE